MKTLFRITLSVLTLLLFHHFCVGVEGETIISDEILTENEADQGEVVDLTLDNDDSKPTSGNSYAVLTDEGELIFLRSYSGESDGTITDIYGNNYAGVIFGGVENLESNGSSIFGNYSESVIKIRVAENQIIKPHSMRGWFCFCKNLKEVDLHGFDTSEVKDMSNLFFYCQSIQNIDLSFLDFSTVEDMSTMFQECINLEYVNVKNLDTSHVTNMRGLFSHCLELRAVDVSGFNTKSVTNMGGMFSGCEELTSIDVKSFDTSKVQNMSGMFGSCQSLTELDVSGFNTGSVTSMSNMFYYCSNIKELDVSNFNTSMVTNMEAMFSYCCSVKALDVTGFSTSQVTNFAAMFSYCEALTEINITGFDTSNATRMGAMFEGCSSLKNLDCKNLDVHNADALNFMFYNCKSLTSLDLHQFDTSKSITFNYMFTNCTNLKTLDISSFDSRTVKTMYDMFKGCDSLTSIKIGPKFAVWKNNAYLPKGIWTDGKQSYTEKDLYSKYPSNASEWCGVWHRDVPTAIKLNVNSAVIDYGQSYQLKATITPADCVNQDVQWSVYKSACGNSRVNDSGLVTSTGADKVTIQARTVNGLTELCDILIRFKDVRQPSQYFYDPVYWAIEKSITVGAGGVGKFSPNATCTREQIVTFLWRLIEGPVVTEHYEFTDVDPGDWYYDPISWAAREGITFGLNDGTGRFGVGQPCTREQCVTFLYRAAGSPEVTNHQTFTDVSEDKYYYDAISWAAEEGITVGLNDGTGRFGVGQKCTRAMIVTFLYRYANR